MIVTLLGGIGLFLLGMTLMTDGLKALAGGALRRVLTRSVRRPISGLLWGAGVTAIVQSSTATTLTTIGFVSAGLLTFPQSVGVILGANLGVSSTGWIVSVLGFKLSIGAAALPVIFGGAMMRLLGRERVGATGLAMAGFGLLFLGIGTLQQGMSGLTEWLRPSDLPGDSLVGRAMLVGIGLIITVVMQSSSAALAMTIVALSSGAVTLNQAAALVIGQNVGSAVSTAIASAGASAPAKRTALAHILFNVVSATAAFVILPLLTGLLNAAAARAGGKPGAVSLAAFHTTYNVLGVLLLFPVLEPFSRLVTRMVPERGPALTRRLDRSVAQAGPVAIEAARRTLMDIAAVAVESARALVTGDRPRRHAIEPLNAAERALAETRRFVGRLGAMPQTADERGRHLSTLHAIDHIALLLEACREPAPPAAVKDYPALTEMAAGVAAMLRDAEQWLKEEGTAPVDPLAAASRAIAVRRRAERARTLENTAAGKLDPDRALAEIEALRWLDRLGYHTWRAAHHLHDPPPSEGEDGSDQFRDTLGQAAAAPEAVG